MSDTHICTVCETRFAGPKAQSAGKRLGLLLAAVAVALIVAVAINGYLFWPVVIVAWIVRALSGRPACPVCHSHSVIPIDSPAGQKILGKSP